MIAVVVLRVRAGLVASGVDVAVEAPRVVIQSARPAQEFRSPQFRTLRPVLDRRAITALLQQLLLLWLSGCDVQFERRRPTDRRRVAVRLTAIRMSHGRRSAERMQRKGSARLDHVVIAQIDEDGRVDGRRSQTTTREQALQTVFACYCRCRWRCWLLRRVMLMGLMLLDVMVGGHGRSKWHMARQFAQFAAALLGSLCFLVYCWLIVGCTVETTIAH